MNAAPGATQPEQFRRFISPGLLLLLTLALMLVGAAMARPGVVVTAADPTAGRTLVRFYGVERNAT
ncbi:MAG: hypothetical protein WCP31_09290, partial [Chloroflexales bacterium]